LKVLIYDKCQVRFIGMINADNDNLPNDLPKISHQVIPYLVILTKLSDTLPSDVLEQYLTK